MQFADTADSKSAPRKTSDCGSAWSADSHIISPTQISSRHASRPLRKSSTAPSYKPPHVFIWVSWQIRTSDFGFRSSYLLALTLKAFNTSNPEFSLELGAWNLELFLPSAPFISHQESGSSSKDPNRPAASTNATPTRFFCPASLRWPAPADGPGLSSLPTR